MGNVYGAVCQPGVGLKRMKRLSQNEKNVLLRDNQVGVVSLVAINWILAVLVVIASLVPDFAVNSGGWPHVVWAVGAMAVTLFALLGQGFSVNVNAQRLVNYVRFSIVVIILAAAATLVHAILSVVEVVNCTSDLCTNANSPSGFAFLVVSIVFSFSFALLYLWLWWRSAVFAANVESAIATDWTPGVWEDLEEPAETLGRRVRGNKKKRHKLKTRVV